MTHPDPIPPFETDHELAWRIDLINSMIKENPEYTILDYEELVRELKLIENTKKYRNNL